LFSDWNNYFYFHYKNSKQSTHYTNLTSLGAVQRHCRSKFCHGLHCHNARVLGKSTWFAIINNMQTILMHVEKQNYKHPNWRLIYVSIEYTPIWDGVKRPQNGWLLGWFIVGLEFHPKRIRFEHDLD
jgi:hypothetical protein